MSLTRRIAGALSTRAVVGMEGLDGWASAISSGSWGGVFLTPEEGNWSASATAYRCVATIATQAASLPMQVREDDDTNVEGHWLPALYERPNPLLSRRVFAEVLWGRMETRGETFVYVNRGPNGTGRPSELWPIWGRVEPVVAGRIEMDGQVTETLLGFQVYVGGKRIPLLPEEVLWLRYPSPSNKWGALAPLEAAGHAIELDAYARAWQQGEFQNGAKPKHVVYLGDLSKTAHDAAVENWRSQVEGHGNSGKSLLVSGPTAAKVDRITMTPEEMSWLNTRVKNAEEVMLAFGVPKDYLMGGATYENRAASKTTLWSDTIVPKLEVVASEMTRQLLADEPGRRVRLDTDDVDALQEGADAKAKRTTDLTAHDVVTLDEARAEMGLDPLDGGIGAMTLTMYRTWVALEAQQTLLAGQAPADRHRLFRLPEITPGRVMPNAAASPMLLPSGARVHGPDRETILAEYDRLERITVRAVGRLAARQQAVVLTNADRLLGGKSKKAQAWLRDVAVASLAYTMDPEQAEGLRVAVGDLFDSKHWAAETQAAMEAPVGAAWESGAMKLAASLGLDFSKFDLLVLTAMDARLEVLADQVTATTRQVIEDRVLLEGVANGESIDQLKARIRGIFSDLKSWRAATIARTETVGGFNKASLVIAEGSGVVAEREWLNTMDSRTRDTHKDAPAGVGGTRVSGFTARYGNGCLHPGDPTARAEETINCRCCELYVTND